MAMLLIMCMCVVGVDYATRFSHMPAIRLEKPTQKINQRPPAHPPELDVGEPDGEERKERDDVFRAHHLFPGVPEPLQDQILMLFVDR